MSNTEMLSPDFKQAKKLLISYVISFGAALLLILISFFLVTHPQGLSEKATFFALALLLVLQLGVQVVFSFRLRIGSAEDRWNFWVFVFTLLIMSIVVTGSLWIMYNLNYNMGV